MADNYTYELVDQGYVILVNGRVRYVQKDYIPYPGDTVEESAQNHIDQIIADQKQSLSMEDQVQQLMLAVAELGNATSTSDAEIQLAIAELASQVAAIGEGGAE